jgi:PhnB protein
MAVTPYLLFDGRCTEAIEFYQKHLGAEVGMVMRFKDAPPQEGWTPDPAILNRVMHASVTINGTPVMMSDGCEGDKAEYKGFALALDAKTAAEGERLFQSLSEGGTVRQPLIETFFADRFGMLTDKFGIGWMVVAGSKNP